MSEIQDVNDPCMRTWGRIQSIQSRVATASCALIVVVVMVVMVAVVMVVVCELAIRADLQNLRNTLLCTCTCL